MQIVRFAASIAALAVLAGCASGGNASTQPVGIGSSQPPGSPPGSASGVPLPAPSDSEPIRTTGAVRVLSLNGPFEPAGPVLAGTVPGLLNAYRGKLAGRAPACPNVGCWHGATVPAGSLLVSVRPALVACSHLQQVSASRPMTDLIRIDLQLTGSCRPGAGSAARMPGVLLALDSSTLPATGSVRVQVALLGSGGVPTSLIGTVTATLPLTS